MRFCEKSLQVIFLIFWMKLQQHKCFKVPKKTSNKKAQKNVLFLIFLGTKVVWIVIEMKFQGFMKSQFMELFWFFLHDVIEWNYYFFGKILFLRVFDALCYYGWFVFKLYYLLILFAMISNTYFCKFSII